MFSQIQAMMQPYDGPLNWDLALDLARKQAATSADPSPTQRQQDQVADAVRLADHWLDATTDFPSGVSSTAAWSRAEWIVGTTEVWKGLVEPIAASSVNSIAAAMPQDQGLARADGRTAHRHAPARRRRRCSPPRSARDSAPSPARC